jgi:hypothetical protein
VQITQGEAWAQVKMFELQKDGTFTVTEWEGKDTFRLACDIDKAIMANKGVNCVAEQMKAAIVLGICLIGPAKSSLRRGRSEELLKPRIISEPVEHWIEPEQRRSERQVLSSKRTRVRDRK